ncbi:MAG: low molecular weight protein-tyrosine-phosphatase epsP [Pseudomonadota bacterium]
MFNNILVVCIGNICRSPMAEALLKQALVSARKANCHVVSAGLAALVGHRADPIAQQLMTQSGIDISDHRACQLHPEMVRKADLILTMELSQRNTIIDSQPDARGKVFRLGEWGGFDIADPYQKGAAAFEESLALIEQGISQWIEKL